MARETREKHEKLAAKVAAGHPYDIVNGKGVT